MLGISAVMSTLGSINYAQQIDVRGALALPVFERGSRVCLGVVEVVMTKEKIDHYLFRL